jgi:hypothetical protein
MAEDTKEPETTDVAVEAAPVAPKIYVLQSTVRSRHNRTKRASVPGRQPFTHRIAGGRILVRRARPARITEAVLLAHLDEIKLLVSRHHLVVTTPDGREVDLTTFQVGAPAVASPLPNPPLDSAKNDKNENVGYNVPGAPEGTTMDAEEPAILREALNPDFSGEEVLEEGDGEESDEETETVSAETTSTPVKPLSTPPQGRKHGKKGR